MPRFWWRTVFAVGVIVWAVAVTCGSADVGGFSTVATHPDAVLQDTERGQTLNTLHAVDDILYVGYGDYGFDTGPINLRAFDTNTDSLSDVLGIVNTHAIYRIQDDGSRVFALTTDPLLRDPGGYLMGTSVGSPWEANNSLPFLHVYDFAKVGDQIFLSGSGGPDDIFHSVVYGSSDGGATWDLSLHADLPEEIEGGNGNFSRFYGAAEMDGDLYVQQVFFRTGVAEPSTLFRFDGQQWHERSAPLTPEGEWTYFIDPDEFHGQVVVRDAHPGELSPAYQFDGTDLVKLKPDGSDLMFYDQYVDGDSMYMLTGDRRVIVSDDLVEWETVAEEVPASFRSLAVVGNNLFFGSTDSKLHRFVMSVPEPSMTVTMMLLGLLWVRHTRKLARVQ